MFEVLTSGNVSYSFSNSEPEAAEDPWEGCGSVGYQRFRDEEMLRDARWGWGAGQGRFLMVDAAGEERQVNRSGSGENLALIRTFHYLMHDQPLEQGDRLAFTVATGRGEESPYAPWMSVNLTGSRVELRVVEDERYPFACGATLEPFDGEKVAVGMGGISPVSVRDASHAVDGSDWEWTGASLLVALDPRFQGVCDVAVTVDGELAEASGRQTDLCFASAEGAPGEVSLDIREIEANAPAVRWTVSGMPPLLDR